MNNIRLKTFSAIDFVEKICKQFSIEIDPFCFSKTLQIPAKFGNGKIIAVDFNNGLSSVLFDIKLRQTLSINFEKGSTKPLNFLHCNKGILIHKLCDDSIHYQLESMRNSITSCPTDAEQSLVIPAGQNMAASLLSINRAIYTELSNSQSDEMPSSFVSAINDQASTGTFFYRGNSDYQLSRSLSTVFGNNIDTKEAYLLAERNILIALEHFIHNYKRNQSLRHIHIGLTQYDIDCLRQAEAIITENLSNAPTIPELAKLVGINQQKLKKGFKSVFGKTINQFLIQKRMEAARILLTQNENSIREVAAKVGYSNQSHFSSKFREHFGILPKDFVKSVDINYLRSSTN